MKEERVPPTKSLHAIDCRSLLTSSRLVSSNLPTTYALSTLTSARPALRQTSVDWELLSVRKGAMSHRLSEAATLDKTSPPSSPSR